MGAEWITRPETRRHQSRSCDGESDDESIPELVPAGEYDEYERITAVEYSGLYAAFEASFDSLWAG